MDQNNPGLERKIVVCGACAKQIGESIIDVVNQDNYGQVFLPPLLSEFYLEANDTKFLIKIYTPKKIKPFWYPTVSMFIVSFDLLSKSSLQDVTNTWVPLLKDNAPNTPLIFASWDSSNSTTDFFEADAVCKPIL